MNEKQAITGGYVMVPREIVWSPLFFSKPAEYFKIYIYILLRLNHTTNKLFPRGEGFFNFTETPIPSVTRSQIYSFLRWAKKEKLLTAKKSTRGVIIKLNDYDFYQNPQNYLLPTKDGNNMTLDEYYLQQINWSKE